MPSPRDRAIPLESAKSHPVAGNIPFRDTLHLSTEDSISGNDFSRIILVDPDAANNHIHNQVIRGVSARRNAHADDNDAVLSRFLSTHGEGEGMESDLEIRVREPLDISISPTSSKANSIHEIAPNDPSVLDVHPAHSARVRFRSRVRITSGINRHRHKSSSFPREGTENDHLGPSAGSSMSGSPSSSISAPLHSLADDEVGKPGWGTLGQRVGLFAQNSKRRQMKERRGSSLRKNSFDSETDINERSPLLQSNMMRPTYAVANGGDDDPFFNSDRDDEARLSREIDLIFGTWPSRLLNHHWWWWQLEPIVCCRCIEDSDSED